MIFSIKYNFLLYSWVITCLICLSIQKEASLHVLFLLDFRRRAQATSGILSFVLLWQSFTDLTNAWVPPSTL